MGLFDYFEARTIVRELDALHRAQKPVRIEIENRGVRFKTLLTIRKDVVAVARPMGFKWELPVGTMLRVRLAGVRRDVRLQVVNPDYRLPNGRSFFVCPIPKQFAAKSPRASERYSTARFKNLEMLLPSLGGRYRILDLSMKGCRIDTGREQLQAVLNLGERIAPAEIRVGSGIRIPLESIVPRTAQAGTVGVEFRVEHGSRSPDYLDKLVKWLDKWEDKQTRVLGSAAEKRPE
jgi:hypothetical protein